MEIILTGNKKVSANYAGFEIKTDQPIASGGDGTAPSPFDLFLASLGTCAGFYVASFCNSREIPVENITLNMKTSRSTDTNLINDIQIKINLPKDFPEKYRNAVIKAAEGCTVKKHLAYPPEITVSAEEKD